MTDLRPAPAPAPTDERLLPAVIYALYLIGLVNGLTLIIGAFLALANRDKAPPKMASHYTFQIRTALLGAAAMVAGGVIFAIGIPLTLILVGLLFLKLAWLIWGLTAVWLVVRCVLGLIYLGREEAYPRPEAYLA
ncbi:MAG: hypothetical protein U1E50_08270 [Caulobacteraceae bacterium]